MKYVFIAILAIIIFATVTTESFAQASRSASISTESINPGTFMYSFKRLWEKIGSQLLFSNDAKYNFNKKLLNTRLAELSYLIEKKSLDSLESSSSRFSYQAGVLADLSSQGITKEEIMSIFEGYNPILANLRDRFEANSAYWLLIQQNIDTLKILSDKLN